AAQRSWPQTRASLGGLCRRPRRPPRHRLPDDLTSRALRLRAARPRASPRARTCYVRLGATVENKASREQAMRGFSRLSAIVVLGIGCLFSGASFAQAPTAPPQLITRAEVRAIIDGAIAYATEKHWLMGVAVVDTSGDMIGSERMDGAGSRNVQ